MITSEKLEADIPRVDRVQWRKIDAKGLYTNDIQRLYKVASSIVHISQQDLDLSTYIGQIASLKEEFLTVMPLTPDVGAQQTQLDKFFMVLTLIGLRPDLEPVRDQILVLKLALEEAAVVPEVEVNVLISSDSPLPQPPSSSASQASVTSIAQPGNAFACLTHTSSLGPWILDSGASDHLSGNKDLFSSITTTSALPTVTLANGSQTVAKGIGLALPLPSLPLTSVLYTPECPFNLISISKITRTLNCSITFFDKFVTLQDRSTGKTIDIRRESQGLYHLTSDSSPAVCISTDAPLLIHNRLGHPSLSKFQKMVPRFSTLSSLPCESCQLGKHTRVSFPKRLNNRAKSPFELVHTNVWGPCRIASTLGFQYFVTFIDDYSRSERKNRHLVETTLTILLHSNVPFRFWGDVVLTACYLINRMPSSVLHDQIPHSLLFSDQPLYFLPPRVFGCTCFVHILTPRQDKLSAKAMKCLFLGYSRLQKGYRCYSLETHQYFISADVTFLRTHHSFPPLLSLSSSPSCRCSSPFAEAPADSLPIPSASPARLCLLLMTTHCCSERYSLYSWFVVGVYAVTVGPDGQVDRLKARLVAKGYTQVYGSDYGDTFSPVAKIASVRLLLSMAAMCSWPLYQLDIKNVFRSLYGLNNLLEHGFGRFSSVVQEFGMLRSTADHSVFYHHNSLGQCIYLVVYVDDIVITSSDQNGIQKLKQHLFTHFQTKDLGKLKYFLGIEIAQSSSGVVLSQRKYALDILEETSMLDCNRYTHLWIRMSNLYQDRGSLEETPGDIDGSHWDAVIRILRYIKSTPGQGVLYENRGHTQVVGYTDAIGLAHLQIDIPLQGTGVFIGELRFGKDEQMKLICDNQAALHIASNPVFHERTKHIEVDYHFH
ncbi:Retrovirus-related Pol polyprotein from transposon RE1 [Vitis vinifera]|uniref:Retrovirus-related Pol polyprotein from transposon RE1 n=1 Tax=Vitis vinifera TaxID=29760 RepID=A0A438GRZ1_VITVI|nr:Retrovirus-related Pol polyprotein from transposon RE1 [Vitis vinifera]